MDESPRKIPRRVYLIAFSVVFCLIVLVGLLNWSVIGTKLANPMRSLLGVRTVAQIETFLFKIQDGIETVKYRVGLSEPELPWSGNGSLVQTVAATEVIQSSPTPAPLTATPLPSNSQESDPANATTPPQKPSPTSTHTAVPTPSGWSLPDIEPFGDLAGEGVWLPYIHNEGGEVIALRTFLQPDPERPYTLVAVVAFDLSQADLRFVLGLKEPSKPGGPHGYGVIPDADRQPGRLLAAFNGGFIAEHGGYGAMADGVTALAAKAGLATLAIYEDGDVRIGEWGNDFYVGEAYQAWRQNALMIIHNGEINPKVETGSWIEWGANLDGATATLRSSIGLSEDNRVLYYFAGPNLSMPALADAMFAAGVYNGMLLDINPTHAHFTAMRAVDGELVAEPLYEEEMDLWIDRYLHQWDQDFFYVTTKE